MLVEDDEPCAEPDPEPVPVCADDDSESPRTETELPETVTGAVTGASTWLPPATESSPSVLVEDDEPCAEPDPEPVPVCADDDSESPRTETELPETVTGAVTGASTWFPPATESSPSVLVEDDEPCAEPDPEPVPVCADDDSESPRTETELPETVTGAVTAEMTWSPPRRLSVPDVVSSAQAGAANRSPPPTRRAAWSPLRTYACMSVVLPDW
nr:hypothetical protein [Phycicoccus endophyticus]